MDVLYIIRERNEIISITRAEPSDDSRDLSTDVNVRITINYIGSTIYIYIYIYKWG